MITINYKFSDSRNSQTARLNLANADEIALRYDLFLGDINFESNGAGFSTDCGWIPLLDFFLALSQIIRNLYLKNNGEESFEFTESERKIIFVRHGLTVAIRSTLPKKTIEVPFAELIGAVDEGTAKFHKELLSKYPLLRNNREFLKLCSGEDEQLEKQK